MCVCVCVCVCVHVHAMDSHLHTDDDANMCVIIASDNRCIVVITVIVTRLLQSCMPYIEAVHGAE